MPSRWTTTINPANIVISRPSITVSTVRALRQEGGWKTGTALEIASIPVIAVAPEENARSTSSTLTPSIGFSPTAGVVAKPREEACTSATPISTNIAITNAYVGAEKVADEQDRDHAQSQRDGG